MRRRTFLAAVPAVAVGAALSAQTRKGRASAPAPSDEGRTAAFQPSGEEKFERPDVHAGDRPVGASFGSRSAVYGRSGAAGTAHPLATLAGIEMLKKGGSAADAAIAINACLGFLEPTSSGIGGDMYAMLWDPAQNKVMGLAGSGRSPRALSLETVRSRAKNGALPPLGAVAVSVPGAVDGWWTLHQRYGRLKWAELFEPAIAYAEAGVPVPEVIAYYMRRNLAGFLRSGAGVEETANAVHTYGKGPASAGCSATPISPAPTG